MKTDDLETAILIASMWIGIGLAAAGTIFAFFYAAISLLLLIGMIAAAVERRQPNADLAKPEQR